ncbi:hypothetical protein DU53_03130 [Kosmotoga sp. DU53]|nr:two-component system, chemotaxis family, protein-glutamate methylesterase/glutaminase [Kosmotoga sp.]OAA23027.1 hypothetical protein DU53_03130 [Kosmotoga sp. DU53]
MMIRVLVGDDRANAIVKIKNPGGYTITESEDTDIIYGMLAKVIERECASIVLPSYSVVEKIIKKVGVIRK